ncbi:hypothetical protein QW180_29790 [Vibrio sinaloensis]|nr:hypothetical protein [Vibrio sinaloensis]
MNGIIGRVYGGAHAIRSGCDFFTYFEIPDTANCSGISSVMLTEAIGALLSTGNVVEF